MEWCALLSRRLKEMEALGLVERMEDKAAAGAIDYFRTEKSINLEPAMNALAEWAQQNIEADIALSGADASTIMWAVRRKIDLAELPRRRAVIRFHFRDDPPPRYPHYWFVVEPGADLPELCSLDPGLARSMDRWLRTSGWAALEGIAQLS